MTENENQGATVERIIARDTPTAPGEPSDAQIEAALQEWWYGNHEDTWESKMRAALRAAGVVR